LQKSEQAAERFGHTASGMWAYCLGLAKYAANKVLGVQFAQTEWAICKALKKKPSCVEEILPHGFRSKTSLLCQVLREPELQLIERTHLWFKTRNYFRFLQTLQQRPQRGRIPSLLAVSLCSVVNEFFDTLFGEAFHFYSALPHPLVERSHKAEFVGDTLFGISSVGKRVCESGNVRI
jgi:hypothetical protein